MKIHGKQSVGVEELRILASWFLRPIRNNSVLEELIVRLTVIQEDIC